MQSDSRGQAALSKRRSAWLAVASVLVWGLGARPASADVSFAAEYMKRLKMYETVQPLGETPFGENVNLYTGELGFNQTDVALEGQGPTLVLAREYRSARQYAAPINTMEDWKLSIPRMETMSKGGWQVATYPNGQGNPVASYARCSQFGPAYDEYGEQSLWWQGYELINERNERQQVLKRSASFTTKPTGIDAGFGVLTQFPAVTQQNWQIGCLPTTSNGKPGEGFLAISPDGTRYFFDYLVSAPATTVYEYDPDLKLPIKHFRSLQVLYVTRIEDRFGNYLSYAYDASRLTSITGSDGRKATVLWNPGTGPADQTVTQITLQPNAAAPRHWYYTYEGGRLRYVKLPDNSQWSFALQEAAPIALPTNTCGTRAPGDVTGPQTVSTVVHPSGLTGSFVTADKLHARSYVPSYCDPIPPSLEVQENNFPIFNASSLLSKTLSGPGMATGTWTYTYSVPVGSTTQDPCAANNTCQDWRTVEVKDPGGDRIRYTLNTRFGPLESKLEKTEFFEGAAGTPLRTDTVEYAAHDSGPFPASLGGSFQVWQTNSEKSNTWTPERKRTTVQQGVTFIWSVDAVGQGYAFDTFAKPLKVTRSSTPGYSRTDTLAYSDNLAYWVMGQAASSTCTAPAGCAGLVESKTDYNAQALPWKSYAFGKLRQTLIYHPDGTVDTATDGNGNITTLSGWKRGIPQLIAFADGTERSAVVDDFSQIASVTDENGYITKYGYDKMGRMTLVDYPDGDSTAWNNTATSFSKVAAAEYGLASGHWKQVTSTGNARKEVYFDAMFRPVLERQYDNAYINNTLSEVVRRYDTGGRVIFESYPTRGVTEVSP